MFSMMMTRFDKLDTRFDKLDTSLSGMRDDLNHVHQELQAQGKTVTTHSAQIQTQGGEIAKLRDEQTATNERIDQHSAALGALRKGVEVALRATQQPVVLLSNFDPTKDNADSRKKAIDTVTGTIKKKVKTIEHMQKGPALDQFTRVVFESHTTASQFITAWVAAKIKNGNGHNVYARMEQPKALREMRRPLTNVDRGLKAMYRADQEKHEVRVNWKDSGVITVDKLEAVRMNGDGTVTWIDGMIEARYVTFINNT